MKFQLEQAKGKFIDALLRGFYFIIIPTVFFSFIRLYETGWKLFYLLQCILAISFIILYFFRTRFSVAVKTHIVSSLILLLSFVGVVTFSISGGHYMCLLSVMISTIVLGRRVGIYYLILSVLGLTALSFLHVQGIIQSGIDFNTYNANLLSWITIIYTLTVFMSIIIYPLGIFHDFFILNIEELVTVAEKQKQVEKALVESQIQFSTLFESTSDYICSIDTTNYTVLSCNIALKQFLAFHDITVREGDYIKDLLSEELTKHWFGIFAKVLEEGSYSTLYETSKNNQIVNINLNLLKRDSVVFGISLFATDITQIKKTERELIERNKFVESILDLSPSIIYVYDLVEHKNIYSNQGITKNLGFSLQEVQSFGNLLLKNLMHPDDFNHYLVTILPLYNKVLESDQISHQYRLKDINGSWHWIDSIEMIYKRDNDGTAIQILGIARDISDRKEAQAALYESDQLLHNLNLLAKEGLMIHENGIILDANLAYATMLGYSSVKEVIGKQGIAILGATDKSMQIILEHFKNNVTKSYEIEKITENGSIKYFEIRAEHITYKGRKARLVFLTDISERKYAEIALLEREQRFQEITCLSGIMVYEFVVETKKIVFGGAIEKVTGYLPQEFESINFEQWCQFTHPDERSSIVDTFICIARLLQPFRIEYRMLNKQNEYIWIEVESYVMSENGKVPSSIIGVIQDITEKKALERQILNSVIETEEKERLHFSQELHDGIGPLLSASKMYVNWLTKPNAVQNKDEIIKDIDKLLTESIKTVREISFKLSPHILLHYGLVEALNVFNEKIVESSTLTIDLHTVNVERFEEKVEIVVYRVLCECINNTIKHASASTIKIDMICKRGILKVCYYDDGCGFEIADISKRNKGIGLLNMQSRLKSINGKMNISSIPNKGTTIKIEIKIDTGLIQTN